MRNNKGQFIQGNSIGKEYRFTSEISKGNQHAKGNPPNKTSFKSENIQLAKHPCWKGGIQKTKKDGLYIMIESKKRIPYARYVYLKHHNMQFIPKGHVIYHFDGNVLNNDIENLYLITRAELIKINKQKKYENNTNQNNL